MLVKINILTLIEALQEMYDDGAYFVDIGGNKNPHEDEVFLGAREEYYIKEEKTKENPLSDEDINQLL